MAAFPGERVSDNQLEASSPPRQRGAKPVRDSRGRWVRQTTPADHPADKDCVFDDRIFESPLSPLTEELLLRPEAPAADTATPDPPAALVEPHRLQASPASSSRVFSRSALLLVGALSLLGGVFFVVQHWSFSARRADVATPPQPTTILPPVVIPPVPKQTARRPAARSVPAAPVAIRKETVNASPLAVVPPAVQPAPAARPIATPVVAGETVAADGAPSPATADEEGWFKLAEEYRQLGDEQRAEALYRRILSEGTEKGRAALALGDLFARRNDFDRAREFYRASKRFFQNDEPPTSQP